jgi:general secretion pathway protein G
MTYHQELKNNKGMTLVEILAVILLIGLIMTVVVKGVMGKSDSAKANLNTIKMEKVKQYLSQYRLQYNSYPSSLDGLVHASGDVQKSGQVFISLAEEDELTDVWGNPLLYKSENNGRSYSLTSLGSDGVQGGDGANTDITLRP